MEEGETRNEDRIALDRESLLDIANQHRLVLISDN